MPRPGWLKRQFEAATEELKHWPSWLRGGKMVYGVSFDSEYTDIKAHSFETEAEAQCYSKGLSDGAVENLVQYWFFFEEELDDMEGYLDEEQVAEARDKIAKIKKLQQQKDDKYCESKVKKGGVNKRPTTPRPPPPKGQGGSQPKEVLTVKIKRG